MICYPVVVTGISVYFHMWIMELFFFGGAPSVGPVLFFHLSRVGCRESFKLLVEIFFPWKCRVKN